MKLGDVLKKERENRNITAAKMAGRLGISLSDYEQLELGKNSAFEDAAAMVVAFNEMIGGQVNQLFYPCGLPFSQVVTYKVTT